MCDIVAIASPEYVVEVTKMSEQEKKKVSLKDAMKQQLANKKQQSQQGQSLSGNTKMQKMNSQQTKKTNNQRRRMGV